jgi:hypothetical protein
LKRDSVLACELTQSHFMTTLDILVSRSDKKKAANPS